MERFRKVLVDADARDAARKAIGVAPRGHVCEIKPVKRSVEQNRRLHAIFEDIARFGYRHHGETYDADEWKWLMTSGHAIATGKKGRMCLGVEGERLMLRPSTSAMSVAEMTSLIEYCQAFCADKGIYLRDGQ